MNHPTGAPAVSEGQGASKEGRQRCRRGSRQADQVNASGGACRDTGRKKSGRDEEILTANDAGTREPLPPLEPAVLSVHIHGSSVEQPGLH